MNYLERRLEPYQTIEHSLSDILMAFIDYYGKENEDYILERFNNMFLICTRTPGGIKRILNQIKKAYSDKLINMFFQKFKIELNQSNIQNIFGLSKIPFENISSIPIIQYLKFQKDNIEALFENEVQLLNAFYPIDLSSNNQDIETFLEELFVKYKTYTRKFQDYEKYIEKCHELKQVIHDKYMDELIENFKNEFSDAELMIYQNKGQITGKMKLYLGTRIEINPLIAAFSKENERILNDSKAQNWKKKSIKKDRISFFKTMGIDLGDNYQKYKYNKICLSLIPPIDLVEDIICTKEELELKMYNEYFESLPEYKANREKLDNIGLLSKDDGYNASAFLYSETYVTPNFQINTKKPKIYPLVNINFDYPNEFLDKYIIHELNHVYELTLVSIDENATYYTSGWELLCENKNLNSKKHLDRKYNAFNEIINDMLATEITQKLHQNNCYMFYSSEEAKTSGGTSYENYRFLVQGFYNEFKEDIIASRRGNLSHLLDICGEKNFEELNDLINNFISKWTGLNIVSLLSDIKHHRNTQNTIEYQKIIEKRDEILRNMIQYKKKSRQDKELVLCQRTNTL